MVSGQEVVHDREDRLLDLAGVLGAHDEDHALLEVDEDSGLGVRAVDLGIELERGSGHDDEVGLAEVAKLLVGRTNEHLVNEERLAGKLADSADLAGVATLGTGETVHDKETALGEVTDDLALDLLIVLLGERHVDVAPGDPVMDVGRVDDEAVLGRAAGVLTGDDGEGAGARELALATLDGSLDQHGRGRVNDGLLLRVGDAVALKFLDDHMCLLMAGGCPPT